MTKKTGLGKGLDALFGENPVVETIEETKDNEIVHKLKIIEVEPNKAQPRRTFDSESLADLSESIKRYGVIQPIIVVNRGKYYEIVAGERRWRAAKLAGITEIPAIVRDDDERRNKEIALIENIQREDLNPIEKAKGIKLLMEEYQLTQQQVSEVIGKSRSAVANTVRILNLDERIIQLVLEGKLTEGHCKALLSIEDKEKQYEMALYILKSGDTVREAEKKMKAKKQNRKKDKKYEAIFRDMEDKFQGYFGTKVKIDAGKKKGKIVIEYTSNEDLERIIGLIQ